MPTKWSDAGTTVDPIARLEARVRWLTALCVFLSVGFAALSAWQFYPRESVLEANRFTLRDDLWRRRAELGFRGDGAPCLRLYNELGQTRVALALADDHSSDFWLADRKGEDRTRFGVKSDGTPYVELIGPDDQGLIRLEAKSSGRAGIELNGAGGERWRAP
jgi:hypothetical protein